MPAPSAAEIKAAGLTPEDLEGEACEVWPENWPTFLLFASLETQWNYAGMGKRVSLNYLVLFAKMDRMNLSPDEYDELESDIHEMELAALAAMNEKD